MLTIYHISDLHIAYNTDPIYNVEAAEVHNNAIKLIEKDISDAHNKLIEKDISDSHGKLIEKYISDAHGKLIGTSMIAITGDIFHYKTETRGADVSNFYNFIKMYANLAPVVCIAGNHDGVASKQIDLLKPLMENISTVKYPVYYLEETGIHRINIDGISIDIAVVSRLHDPVYVNNLNDNPYENFMVKYVNKLNTKCNFRIAMLHDMVEGARLPGCIKPPVSKYFTSMFNAVLLGDIHEHQVFGNCGYAGSLYQQNKSENTNKGILKWTLKENQFPETLFIPVHNRFGHIFIRYNQNNIVYQYDISNITHPKSIRLEFNACDEDYITRCTNEYRLQFPNVIPSIINKTAVQKKLDLVTKHIILPQTESISNLVLNYVEKITDDPNIIDDVKILHNQIMMRNSTDICIEKARYNIKEIKFNNIMIYGSGNVVDFTKFPPGSLIGICSKNGCGKSTFISSILFGLYGITERGDVKSMIRTDKDFMDVSITLETNIITTKPVESDDGIYKIDRVRYRNSAKNNIDKLNTYTGKTATTMINKLVGDMELALYSTIFSQKTSYDILKEKGITQKKTFERIFRLDVINNIKKDADDNFKDMKIDTPSPCTETAEELVNKITKHETDINQLKIEVEKYKNRLIEFRKTKDEYLSQRPPIDSDLLNPDYEHRVRTTCNRDYIPEEEVLIQIAELQSQKIVTPNITIEKCDADISELTKEMKGYPTGDLSLLEDMYNKLLKSKVKQIIDTTMLENEITRLKSISNHVRSDPTFSPTCGCCEHNKMLFGTSNISELVAQLNAIKKTNSESEESNRKRQAGIDKYSKIGVYNKLQQELRLLEETRKNILQNNQIDGLISKMYIRLQEVRSNNKMKELYNQLTMLDKYREINELIVPLEKQIHEYDETLIKVQSEILTHENKLSVDKHKLIKRQEYDIIIKTKLHQKNIAEVYKSCFNNKNGVQVKLLSDKLPLLSETMNTYLSQLDVDFEVRLIMTENDEIEINICKRGGIESVSTNSGYYYDLVNVVLRISIWNLYDGVLPNFMIFDESFSHADSINLSKIIELFRNLKKSSIIPQFILVNSHNTELINSLDFTIEIENDKVGRISRINNVNAIKVPLESTITVDTPIHNTINEIKETKEVKEIINGLSCLLCNKSFKSAGYIKRHTESAGHKKNVALSIQRMLIT